MSIEFIDSIHGVNSSDWNQLCPANYPFIRHEFLAALEDSGSTSARTGWQAQHILLRENNVLVAALPLFIKSHSYGEYVFDWAWADAYHRHGGQYYPKLVSAIPFTPCYGPRLLCAEDTSAPHYLTQIIAAIESLAHKFAASSWHCLFPLHALSQELNTAGIAQRLGSQFHWFNRNYQTFDDFLARMSSRKRKNIIKERREVSEAGITFTHKEGEAITAEDWNFFFELYRLTYLKRSGHEGYLQESFFHLLGKNLPQHTLLIVAKHKGVPIAAALFLRDQHTLYGRYWGCREDFAFLHFETCYYQGIEYAITQGIQRFDGGAQGEHKIQRGFEPVATYSNHWIARHDFRQAIYHFLNEEKTSVLNYIADAKSYLPFKLDDQAQEKPASPLRMDKQEERGE